MRSVLREQLRVATHAVLDGRLSEAQAIAANVAQGRGWDATLAARLHHLLGELRTCVAVIGVDADAAIGRQIPLPLPARRS